MEGAPPQVIFPGFWRLTTDGVVICILATFCLSQNLDLTGGVNCIAVLFFFFFPPLEKSAVRILL